MSGAPSVWSRYDAAMADKRRDPERCARARQALPLCARCVENIGGAGAGPDVPWRRAAEGEHCGADDCDGNEDETKQL